MQTAPRFGDGTLMVSCATCVIAIATLAVTPWHAAQAGTTQAIDSASSKELYEELVRRTTNILAAPAGELSWSKLEFRRQLPTERDAQKLSSESGLLSVYDDAAKGRPAPGIGRLSGVSSTELCGALTIRTATIQKTVYGVDRRIDLYAAIQKRDEMLRIGAPALESTYVKNAEGVGLILDMNLLTKLPSGNYYVHTDTYGAANQLCKVENFWDQPCVSGNTGTGFLIAADRLCTAGHCVPANRDTKRLRVVFGYSLLAPQIPGSIVVNAEDVYSIREVVDRRLTKYAEDWAVLRLDRSSRRTPLRLGTGQPQVNSRVFAIGYPSGLPLKISPDAEVRSGVGKNRCFTAAVDVCGGNSGSPVMSEETGEVQGILVRGDEDFRIIPTGECKTSVIINDAHAGETVCSIATIR